MITLLSLNIEYDMHCDAVKELLRKHQPDLFCFQEVPEYLAKDFALLLGYEWRYVNMARSIPHAQDKEINIGIMIAWNPRFDVLAESIDVYSDGDTRSPVWTRKYPNAAKRIFLSVELQNGKDVFRVGTTHFMWTPDGNASEEQHVDMKALLGVLEKFHDTKGIIFCGDFNAPRGGEIFGLLSGGGYRDNLPYNIVTTLDQQLHRMAPLLLVVDNIFSTKEYNVDHVNVVRGVSDHVALFAQVSKSVC